jgi:hypothetical protein
MMHTRKWTAESDTSHVHSREVADLPLSLHGAGEEHALDHADSPRAEDINEGVASLLGRDLHLLFLVRDALHQRGDERHEERLQPKLRSHCIAP